ncbi:uncharacterized protein ACIQIH_019009 [Cyanocitta cristata]
MRTDLPGSALPAGGVQDVTLVGTSAAGAWKTRGVYSSTKPKPHSPAASSQHKLSPRQPGGTSRATPLHPPRNRPQPGAPAGPVPPCPGEAARGWVGDAAVRGAGPGSPRRSRLDWFPGRRPSPPGFTAFIAPSRQAGPRGCGGRAHLGPPLAAPRLWGSSLRLNPESRRGRGAPCAAVPSPAHPWGAPGAAPHNLRLQQGVPKRPEPPRCCWSRAKIPLVRHCGTLGRVLSPPEVPSGGEIPRLGDTEGEFCAGKGKCRSRGRPSRAADSPGHPSPAEGQRWPCWGCGHVLADPPSETSPRAGGVPAPRLVPAPRRGGAAASPSRIHGDRDRDGDRDGTL